MTSMEHPYFLRVAYFGEAFYGWQIQSVHRSVQGELWKALMALDSEAPLPQGTGRTDAGVHAKDQGALVRVRKHWEPYRLLGALNARLPWDVRVMEAQLAPEGFFPRQHAVAKRYVYRLSEGSVEDPFEHGRRWHLFGSKTLDREAMALGSAHLVGARDFSSFRSVECVALSPCRIIHKVGIESSGSTLDLVFEGNRFLMHQVRIMAGTLVDVGKGRLSPEDLPGILEARDRRRAGQTAPAYGLCLDKVWYQAAWGIGEPCPWREVSARDDASLEKDPD